MHTNLRSFIQVLQKEKEIIEVTAPVDPVLELAEIQRRVVEAQGPALLFTRVKGSNFPVVTNLFGTQRRLELAIGSRPEIIVKKALAALERLMSPKLGVLWQERDWLLDLLRCGVKKVNPRKAPVLECCQRKEQVDLGQLPALVSWPEDGGSVYHLTSSLY